MVERDLFDTPPPEMTFPDPETNGPQASRVERRYDIDPLFYGLTFFTIKEMSEALVFQPDINYLYKFRALGQYDPHLLRGRILSCHSLRPSVADQLGRLFDYFDAVDQGHKPKDRFEIHTSSSPFPRFRLDLISQGRAIPCTNLPVINPGYARALARALTYNHRVITVSPLADAEAYVYETRLFRKYYGLDLTLAFPGGNPDLERLEQLEPYRCPQEIAEEREQNITVLKQGALAQAREGRGLALIEKQRQQLEKQRQQLEIKNKLEAETREENVIRLTVRGQEILNLLSSDELDMRMFRGIPFEFDFLRFFNSERPPSPVTLTTYQNFVCLVLGLTADYCESQPDAQAPEINYSIFIKSYFCGTDDESLAQEFGLTTKDINTILKSSREIFYQALYQYAPHRKTQNAARFELPPDWFTHPLFYSETDPQLYDTARAERVPFLELIKSPYFHQVTLTLTEPDKYGNKHFSLDIAPIPNRSVGWYKNKKRGYRSLRSLMTEAGLSFRYDRVVPWLEKQGIHINVIPHRERQRYYLVHPDLHQGVAAALKEYPFSIEARGRCNAWFTNHGCLGLRQVARLAGIERGFKNNEDIAQWLWDEHEIPVFRSSTYNLYVHPDDIDAAKGYLANSRFTVR